MEHTLQLGEILKDGMYPVESEGGDNWRILHGDTLKLVKAFQPGTFDAVSQIRPTHRAVQSRMKGTGQPIRNTAACHRKKPCQILTATRKISVPGPIGWQSGCMM